MEEVHVREVICGTRVGEERRPGTNEEDVEMVLCHHPGCNRKAEYYIRSIGFCKKHAYKHVRKKK